MWTSLYFTGSGEQCASWFGFSHKHIDGVLDAAPMEALWAVGVKDGEAVVYRLPPIFTNPLEPGRPGLTPQHVATLPSEDAVRAWVAFNI